MFHLRHDEGAALCTRLVHPIAGYALPRVLQMESEGAGFQGWQREGCCWRMETEDRKRAQVKYTLRNKVDKIVSAARRCEHESCRCFALVHRCSLGTWNVRAKMHCLVTEAAEGRKRCCEHSHNLDR